MPRAELPSSARGWLVAFIASFVGFIAGFLTVRFLGDRLA